MLFLANGVWQTSHSFYQISSHKFGLILLGEIEQRIFCRTLCTVDFLLGEQGLVKSTPGEEKIKF